MEIDNDLKGLSKLEGLTLLNENSCLRRAAIDHYCDITQHDLMSHIGSDKSTYKDRIERYALWGGSIYETIHYTHRVPFEDEGDPTPMQMKAFADKVVLHWILDAEIPKKTNRLNVLGAKNKEIGIVCGPHSSAQFCVIALFGDQIIAKDSPAASLYTIPT